VTAPSAADILNDEELSDVAHSILDALDTADHPLDLGDIYRIVERALEHVVFDRETSSSWTAQETADARWRLDRPTTSNGEPA